MHVAETMPIAQLAAHGFSPRLIERWRAGGNADLLPLQARAAREYGFLQGRNLLVLAPTSSGKTFLAELAALKHMEAGRRAVFLVPTKALAEQKAAEFGARYRPLGYRVAVATRERPETDRVAQQGRFDLLVAVYEKMRAYLVARPELLSHVGVVIVDEIQTLGERGRGEGLDLLLAKIASSPYRPQFIGLSAVLSEGGRLADWLKCDLLLDRRRPVELREGALDARTGRFRYRCFNSGAEGDEELAAPETPLPEPDEDGECDAAVIELARRLAVERGEQALIFTPTRALSRRWAAALAEGGGLDPAADAIAELERFEPTASREWLLHCLRGGVAFHNADLPADVRALIEDHYMRGSIHIVVSTPTLAQGVNLAGRCVIQVPLMAATDAWTGETTLVPLSNARFRNQGGRAGRFGLDGGDKSVADDSSVSDCDFPAPIGRSILVAPNAEAADRLFRRYVAGDLEPLDTPLKGRPLDGAALDWIASGLAGEREALLEGLMNTYTGVAHWRGAPGELGAALDEALGRLLEARLIRTGGDGRLEATGIGKAAAMHGLRRESARAMADWLEALGDRAPDALETLLVLAATEDGADFPLALTFAERRHSDYAGDSRARLSAAAEACAPLRALLWPDGGFTARDLEALKKAFLLEAWIGDSETARLEEQFSALAGTIANLAGHAHWLARALVDFADALGLPRARREALERLAARLPLGLQECALGLGRLRVEGLTRGAIQILVREGYDSIEALAEAPAEELARLLPERTAHLLAEDVARAMEDRRAFGGPLDSPGVARLSKASRSTHSNHKGRRCAPHARQSARAASATRDADGSVAGRALPANPAPRLRLDPADPGRAWLDGRAVELTPLPYKLLALLIREAPRTVSRPRIAAELWPDAAVEDQQITHHARAIIKAFSEIVGESEARRIVAVKRGHGLSLEA